MKIIPLINHPIIQNLSIIILYLALKLVYHRILKENLSKKKKIMKNVRIKFHNVRKLIQIVKMNNQYIINISWNIHNVNKLWKNIQV